MEELPNMVSVRLFELAHLFVRTVSLDNPLALPKNGIIQKKEDASQSSNQHVHCRHGTDPFLRSKGSCWVAGPDYHENSWPQTGRILIRLNVVASRYCKTDPEKWDVGDTKGEP